MNSVLLKMQVPTTTNLLPPRGPNIYNGGYKDADKGYIRYAQPSSTYPNLIVLNPIYDDNQNVIMPGYYELVLSEDRQMLILAQAGNIVAKVPVFKVEEDKSQIPKPAPRDFISQKKFEHQEKKKAKEKKRLIKQGKILDEPEIYSNASIDYEEDGGYYLIKYERGRIRAWGAIK